MQQFLTFQVAGAEYGAEILRVKEIIEYERPTPVPQSHAAVRGLINLRGAVVPVVDLAVKMGLPAQPTTRRSCIVIVEAGREVGLVGLAVDAVNQVIDLEDSQIEPPPDFGLPVASSLLRALGKLQKTFAFLLDVDRVLAPSEVPRAESAA
jgi:purine-binding chemotaxis protein CheW